MAKENLSQGVREVIFNLKIDRFTKNQVLEKARETMPQVTATTVSFVLQSLKQKGHIKPEKIKGRYWQLVKDDPGEQEPAEPKVEEIPQVEIPQIDKEELIDWGQALHAYTESLKENIASLEAKVKDMKIEAIQLQNNMTSLQIKVRDKDSKIADLTRQIGILNQRLTYQNVKKDQSFKLADVARFKKDKDKK